MMRIGFCNFQGDENRSVEISPSSTASIQANCEAGIVCPCIFHRYCFYVKKEADCIFINIKCGCIKQTRCENLV